MVGKFPRALARGLEKSENAYIFLYYYITKVLQDSGFYKNLESYRDSYLSNKLDKEKFTDLKEKFISFIIGNTEDLLPKPNLVYTEPMNIAKLKRHPRVFARLFGIEPDKFDALAGQVRPLWLKAESKRLNHPRKIKKGGGRLYALTLEQSVAMLLLYTRAYVTHAFLSALFDVHDSRICRYFARIRPSVEFVFKVPIKKADLSEEEILKLIVDATEQRTERRKKGCGYSGKKKAHTIKTQIVVDKGGTIHHVSASVPGTIHDKKLFDRSGVILPDTAKGDLAYLGTNLTIPFKSSKLHPLTQRQKDWNTRHSRKRIIVEHVFASLKAFRILADRFRGSLINYHQYFLIVCGLRNLARS